MSLIENTCSDCNGTGICPGWGWDCTTCDGLGLILTESGSEIATIAQACIRQRERELRPTEEDDE